MKFNCSFALCCERNGKAKYQDQTCHRSMGTAAGNGLISLEKEKHLLTLQTTLHICFT